MEPPFICEHGVTDGEFGECDDCMKWAEAFLAEWARDIELGEDADA